MTLLAVNNLTTTFKTARGPLAAVNGVSFTIEAGEIVGLVGESGSGKSAASRSIIGLIPQPPGHVAGSVRLAGVELVGRSQRELQRVRGEQVAMIFQDPMTSLNPVYTVGEQVAEALRFHKRLGRAAADAQVAELFQRVGIAEPVARLRAFPHQLSGGMRQRVMIAIAIACQPSLLLADEPTTALDVTIQAQILDLLRDLNRERGMAMLLITHDLGVVAETCQRVMVMYAGRIVEQASTAQIFPAGGAGGGTRHPYTRGLLSSMPDLGRRQGRLEPIPGSPPDLARPPAGCAFAPRCPLARERCVTTTPALRELTPGHLSACHFAEEL